MKIAQRFNAGCVALNSQVPKGRPILAAQVPSPPLSRPSGTGAFYLRPTQR